MEQRVPVGGRAEIGLPNTLIVRAIGLAAGGGSPNLFATLARHRRLFRAWLRFASLLMPRGTLPRRHSELVILRVAHNCRCAYERGHHERLGALAGLSAQEIARTAADDVDDAWPEPQRLLLLAADELHRERTLSEPTWSGLRAHLDERRLIELCLLIGHYEMLAMTINALQIAPDAPAPPPGRLIRALNRALRSRR